MGASSRLPCSLLCPVRVGVVSVRLVLVSSLSGWCWCRPCWCRPCPAGRTLTHGNVASVGQLLTSSGFPCFRSLSGDLFVSLVGCLSGDLFVSLVGSLVTSLFSWFIVSSGYILVSLVGCFVCYIFFSLADSAMWLHFYFLVDLSMCCRLCVLVGWLIQSLPLPQPIPSLTLFIT